MTLLPVPDPVHAQAPAPAMESDPGSAPYVRPAEQFRRAQAAVMRVGAALGVALAATDLGSAVGVS